MKCELNPDNEIAVIDKIDEKIFTIRNCQVMIDRDLAELYGIETKVLNQAVKRNIERFPHRFMFQLTEFEKNELVTNCDRFDVLKHSSAMPYVFTEQGVSMLSAVLKSETAVQVSIRIMDAFVAMRRFMQGNMQIFAELKAIKQHQIDFDIHQKETDIKVQELFKRMDKYAIDDTQGIFFQGQIFDAYVKFESFIKAAKKEIVLIDSYVDLSVLERLTKKRTGVNVKIFTKPATKLTVQDVQKFNAQYPCLTLNHTTKMHDRFLIIDNTVLYHVGASLKDLGKKCFAFEILDASLIQAILQNL
ncbi:MAG: ORF6N domain-containing protein [Fibrobacter sp.]|nr:ORF6N domain-containing protein [Fibrobacter sp.]